jgi:hypothetical protein
MGVQLNSRGLNELITQNQAKRNERGLPFADKLVLVRSGIDTAIRMLAQRRGDRPSHVPRHGQAAAGAAPAPRALRLVAQWRLPPHPRRLCAAARRQVTTE